MVAQRAIPGQTQVQAISRAKANKIPPALLTVPGGLYPMMSSAWEIDEYRIKDGWPVPVPDHDIHADVMVSGDGEYIDGRDIPTSLITSADWRWVADPNFYDQTDLNWAPIQGSTTSWETAPETAPTLVTNYTYSVGPEVFTDMCALNFDSDTGDYMWNDFTLTMGGINGYTVIMVVNPNSIYGSGDDDKIENGLWGPPAPEMNPDGSWPVDDKGNPVIPDGAWEAFTIRDKNVYLTTELQPAQQGVAIANVLSSNAPGYLAFVVRRPQTTLYAATGPSRVVVKSLTAGANPAGLRTDFWLGNVGLESANTANMALLDLGIYADTLSQKDVVGEFALLSQVYGGDK